MEPAIEERVYRLEALMERFIIEMVDYKSQTQYAISRLSNEIRDFKSHTDKIIEEMKEDTRKLKANLDEDTRKLKANLDKDTASLKEEVRKTSKKLGHIIEDIFAPNVQFVAEKYFNCKDCQMFGVRFKQINIVTKQLKEFDVVAVYPDKIVVGEVKSNPGNTKEAEEFIEFIKKDKIFEYFPDKNKKIIPVYAALYMPEDIMKYLTKNKIYAMAMKKDTMEILNVDKISKVS